MTAIGNINAGQRWIPVRTIHRNPTRLTARPTDVMTAPPTRAPTRLHPNVIARIGIEVRAELDAMTARLPRFAPVVVPESGLCHKPIRETFQGHSIEYWCVQDPEHLGDCAPHTTAHAEILHTLPLDHHDAHGCLDAPTDEP